MNTALVVCAHEQRRFLDGKKDSEWKRRVKVVFESPEMRRYGVYEETVYGELVAMIGEIPEVESTLKREASKSFLDNIYKRTK